MGPVRSLAYVSERRCRCSVGVRIQLVSSTTFHDRPVFPRGFRCASRNVGLKAQAKDLAVFASDVDAAAAAIFTRNHFPGAPVIVGREIIKGGRLRAVVVNSRVSNVATGQLGIDNVRRMAAATAAELGTAPAHVLVSSTGVIGVPHPIGKLLQFGTA